MAEDKTILDLDDGGTVQSGDAIPASRSGGDVRVTMAGFVAAVLNAAEEVTSVLTTDIAIIIRDGVIYRATTANLIAAAAPPSGAGQFDFSNAGNSGLAAGAM